MSDDFDTWLAEREKDEDSTDDVETLRPGQRVGAYRIVRQLGVGGMGQVYEAEHVALGVRRALKVFSTVSEHSEFLRKRFVAEGRILADLQHPRIVRVYDLVVDEDSGMAYFEMDLVLSPNGQPRTLADELKDGVDEEKIVGWFKDICEGLAYIHSQGVVHRDISLDNILIDGEGRAVITDFGVAKIIDDSYRRKIDVTVTMVYKDGTEVRMGKDRYMAPELKKQGGKVSFASDAWAVGVLLFHMLSGSWYDVGTRLEDWLADLKYDWRPIVAQLCNVDPAKRLGDGGIAALPAMVKRKGRLVPFWRRVWEIKWENLLVYLMVTIGAAYVLLKVGEMRRKDSDVTAIVQRRGNALKARSTEDLVSDFILERTLSDLEKLDQYDGMLKYQFAREESSGKESVHIVLAQREKIKGDFAIPAKIKGSRVTRIGKHAFNDCDELTSVTIPDSVTSIGDDAFYLCSSLTNVVIPKSVTNIGKGAFSGCRRLNAFSVAGDNPRYKSDSGLLLSKDGKTLIAAIGLHKNLTIPTGVTNIDDGAFSGCWNLLDVKIPSSVKHVGERAFSRCNSLSSVSIPKSVGKIGYQAFDGTSLKTVHVAKGDVERVKNMLLSSKHEIGNIEFRESESN